MAEADFITHACDLVRGDPQLLGASAKLSANVTFTPYSGRVGHLNASGQIEMGCTGKKMPIFLWTSGASAFVKTAVSGAGAQPASSSGRLVLIVGTNPMELSTTEFDTTQTYAINDLLRAVADNANATTGGTLTNANITLGANCTVGQVSKPVATNHHLVSTLTFWTRPIAGSE